VVLQQGTFGDDMFVILRGSMNIVVRKKNSLGIMENHHVNVITDG